MLSITQSPPKAWQAHLKSACAVLGTDVSKLFADARIWAASKELAVPAGDHYATYLASLEETPPNPAIPAFVRRYVSEVLELAADDDGDDKVRIVHKAPSRQTKAPGVPSAAVITAGRNMPPKYMHRQGSRR